MKFYGKPGWFSTAHCWIQIRLHLGLIRHRYPLSLLLQEAILTHRPNRCLSFPEIQYNHCTMWQILWGSRLKSHRQGGSLSQTWERISLPWRSRFFKTAIVMQSRGILFKIKIPLTSSVSLSHKERMLGTWEAKTASFVIWNKQKIWLFPSSD